MSDNRYAHQHNSQSESGIIAHVADNVLPAVTAAAVKIGDQRLHPECQPGHQKRTERFDRADKGIGGQPVHPSVFQRLIIMENNIAIIDNWLPSEGKPLTTMFFKYFGFSLNICRSKRRAVFRVKK